jgi:hypothetical protein
MLGKNITEAGVQCFESRLSGKAGDNVFVKEMKAPQIINAINVISVGMSEKYGINALYMVTQRLGAQVGGSVDQHGTIIITNQQ